MSKPAKRAAKRAKGPSATFPENPRVLPRIPQPYSQQLRGFDRRAAQIERCLPPAPVDGWHRLDDPSPRIRWLLAQALGNVDVGQRADATKLLDEAEQRFRDGQPELRAARHRADKARQREQFTSWSKSGTKEQYGDPTARAEELVRLVKIARRIRRNPAKLSLSEIAKLLINAHRATLSVRRLRYYLSKAGV